MPKEDFFKNLYETEQFIPNKKVATKEQIAEYLRPGYSDAYQDLQSGDFESAYAEIINLQNIPSNSTNFFSGLLVFIW